MTERLAVDRRRDAIALRRIARQVAQRVQFIAGFQAFGDGAQAEVTPQQLARFQNRVHAGIAYRARSERTIASSVNGMRSICSIDAWLVPK